MKTGHPPFSRDWVKSVILKPDAFAGLNDEARDIFLVTINTGMRPSEVSDAPVEDFRVFDKRAFSCDGALFRHRVFEKLRDSDQRQTIGLLSKGMSLAHHLLWLVYGSRFQRLFVAAIAVT